MTAATSPLLVHLPHLVLLLIVSIVFGWLLVRNQPGPAAGSDRAERDREPERSQEPERRRATVGQAVRIGVARRGLIALGPLLAAVATGAVVYGIDLAGSRPSSAVIWIHSGICILVLLLAAYKLRAVGLASLRRAFEPQQLLGAGASVAFSVLFVPLAITGVALLIAPSSSSAWAYAHLITSAWWTALLLWHLRGHLALALGAVRRGSRSSTLTVNA